MAIPLTLADPATWTRLGHPDNFYTSPTLSPSGQWLAVSGRRGIGLTLLPIGGGPPGFVSEDHRGPRTWYTGQDIMCIEERTGSSTLVDMTQGKILAGPDRCDPDVVLDDDLGVELGVYPTSRLYFQPTKGRLTLIRPGRPALRLLEAAMWDVTPAPNGEHVVYATGTLSEPQLFVIDVAGGSPREIGVGAQPTWLPDGSAFIYTLPTRVLREVGETSIEEADLWIHDCTAQVSHPLTQTTHRAEMQPVVSPDGRTVYFADWREGSIHAAAFRRGER